MTSIINVKVDSKIKTKAQKVAAEMGVSLSAVVNAYLRDLIRTETLFVSTRHARPSEWLLNAIREGEEDMKHGRYVSFNSTDKALRHLDSLKKKRS
ncbi:MAG: hypothetical protein EXS55_01400 [Candidatus Magasanikbacteria bacterium]|nr:hypothetical protein [Candidatus Magasanikbacteria bacterium]